jgi:hypothetical protein
MKITTRDWFNRFAKTGAIFAVMAGIGWFLGGAPVALSLIGLGLIWGVVGFFITMD